MNNRMAEIRRYLGCDAPKEDDTIKNTSPVDNRSGNIYVCKCLDARYDEEEGMLVLNCLFEELKEQKIVIFSRNDFHYKGDEVPHIEMRRTAALFKGKRFKLDVGDDPLRTQMSAEDQMRYASTFRETMSDEMGKVAEGLADDQGQIQRKLGRMADEGKLDLASMAKSEMAIRGKLGGIM